MSLLNDDLLCKLAIATEIIADVLRQTMELANNKYVQSTPSRTRTGRATVKISTKSSVTDSPPL